MPQILDEPIPEDCHPEQHADYAGIGLSWGLDHKTASAAQCVALLHAHPVHAKRQQQLSEIPTATCDQQGSAPLLEPNTQQNLHAPTVFLHGAGYDIGG